MWRALAFALAVAAASLLAGCAPEDSLFPLFTAEDKSIDERLLGEWYAQGGPEFKHGEESGRVVFQRGEDGASYNVTIFASNGDPNLACSAHLIRLGSFLFIDLTGADPDKRKLAEIPFPAIESHVFGRLRLEKATAHVDFMDDEWVAKQVKAGKFSLAFIQTPHGPVLSASTEELRKFALEHAEDQESFSDLYAMSRTK
jgi:hypothetical protein